MLDQLPPHAWAIGPNRLRIHPTAVKGARCQELQQTRETVARFWTGLRQKPTRPSRRMARKEPMLYLTCARDIEMSILTKAVSTSVVACSTRQCQQTNRKHSEWCQPLQELHAAHRQAPIGLPGLSWNSGHRQVKTRSKSKKDLSIKPYVVSICHLRAKHLEQRAPDFC